MKKLLLLPLLLSMMVSPLPAGELANKEMAEGIQKGLHHLYNLDFKEAEATFQELDKRYPNSPMVAFGFTSLYWWRLSVLVLEGDEQESAPFRRAADRCIQLAEEKIDAGDESGEAHLVLGGARGLVGRWQAANREWMSAYFTGRSAIKHLRISLEKNPQLWDSYMGIGIFDYFTATLPGVVRVLGFIGQKTTGDKQVGIRELGIAAEKGVFSSTPSKLFLINIYSTSENQPEKALMWLEQLEQEFPTSPFITMLKVISYYNADKPADLEAAAHLFLQRVHDKTYRAEFATQAWFAQGVNHFHKKDFMKAAAAFEEGVKAGTDKDPFFIWSLLYQGYSLDLVGKREEAQALYRKILEKPRRWGSHDNAKARLKKPFKLTDKETTTLVL